MTALVRANGRTLWQLRAGVQVESSPVVVDDTVYLARPTAGSSRSTLRRASPLGLRHGRTDQLEPVDLRPPRLHHDLRGLDLLPDRKKDGKRWDHYITPRLVPLRELLREPLDRRDADVHLWRGRARSSRSRLGREAALDAKSAAGYSTPGSRRTGASSSAASTAGCTPSTPPRAASSGARQSRAGSSRPALVVGKLVFFSTLEQKTYAARVATAGSSGSSASASTRRASRPTSTTTSR